MDEMLIFKKQKNYKEHSVDILNGSLNKYELAIGVTKKFLEQQGDSYMIYENKSRGEISLGIGKYLEISFFSDKIQIKKGDNVEEVFVDDINKDIYNIFKKVHIDEWKAYGFANFSYAKKTFLNTANDDELMKLFIPNIDIRIEKNRILIRYMEEFECIVSMVKDCLSNLKEVKEIITENDKSKLELIKSIEEDYYKSIVSKATEEIKSNKYEKVILSRKINLGKRISFMDSYLEGRKHNNPARSYCMKIDDLEVVGFSPETVVEVDRDKTVYTFPLAGTRALTEDKELNKKLKDELLKDPKEIAEHAVSVKLAYEELEKVCDKDSVSVIQFMDVLERGTVQHLASRLRGKIKDEFNEWHAFTTLFPAVTASGIPKKECIEAIDRLEKDERGLYSGGVLTYDKDGTLDVALVLRTAFQNEKESWVRVGAGIVKLSNPERELEETKEKVGSIINKLVYIED
ncbi:salicylate synthase [Tissierellia bacterium KA00581]|nr:salicylate synthase [Tissierellia bacterium KA00581]